MAVTTTKKSLARTDRAWFRTKVLHFCFPNLVRGGRGGMYRRMVRGEIRMPSLTRSSAANRSSPHVRFAAAILPINCCKSMGIGGRPGVRDFQRHHNRNPLRCQRMSVSGFTTVSRGRHSINHDKAARVMRAASSARRGFACRHSYNANCFRRIRFFRRKLGP